MSEQAQIREQLLASAEALVPVLRERAPGAERLGQLQPETIADFQKAGFFKIVQPKKWGGYECHPNVFFEVQMKLAEGDMSAAWVLGVVAIHNWQMALFDDQAAQDVWGQDPSVLLSSSYMPVAKIERVEGGFNFSGRWGFSSGSEHCDWVFLGGMIPPEKEGGAPDMRTFLLPRSDYEIVENWDVMGLKATGSNDIVVKGAFVPEHRTHKGIDAFLLQSPGNAINTDPLYKIPFGQIFPRAVSTAAIGALQGALNAYNEVTAARVGKNDGKKTSTEPAAQYVAAEASATVDELRLVLFSSFDRMMEAAAGGEPLTESERVKMRWESAVVVQKCCEAVDKLMGCSGGSAIFNDHPMNKFFRDIHSGRGHVANTPEKFGRNWGSYQFGGPNTDFFI
ncbi:MAG: flavin-dependent monooxygenase [Pseudomonadales bacterium]